jgi:Sulfatase
VNRGILAGLLVVLGGSLTLAPGRQPDEVRPTGRPGHAEPIATVARPSKPDIYYIVLDRYGGPRTLERDFDFDNRPFLNLLRARGFYVADQARTNYPRTAQAVASTLDMRFLDYLAGRSDPLNYGPVYQRLKAPRVARFLKARGYRYIKLGSWWTPTASDPYADKNFRYKRPRKLNLYAERNGLTNQERFRMDEYLHRYWQYRQLREVIPKMKGPKFVWAHILCPHEPWANAADGRFMSDHPASRTYFERSRSLHPGKKKNYVEQVKWTNVQLAKLVNELLRGPQAERPVVVIQADEGPYTGLGAGNATLVSIKKLKQKMFVMNAFYLPGVPRPPLYPSFSSVNTFRLIFNLYFGKEYPLLPDRSFVFIYKHLYKFLDVTELVTE